MRYSLSVLTCALLLIGCDSAPKSGVSDKVTSSVAKKTGTGAEKKEAKKADHEHHHGPNGGHMIEVGEEEFHIEWLHEDDGTVTMIVLDGEGKNKVTVPMESLEVETKIGDEAPKSFTLLAKDLTDGKATSFEVTNKSLLGMLENLGEATTAKVKELKAGDKVFRDLAITHDDHDH